MRLDASRLSRLTITRRPPSSSSRTLPPHRPTILASMVVPLSPVQLSAFTVPMVVKMNAEMNPKTAIRIDLTFISILLICGPSRRIPPHLRNRTTNVRFDQQNIVYRDVGCIDFSILSDSGLINRDFDELALIYRTDPRNRSSGPCVEKIS